MNSNPEIKPLVFTIDHTRPQPKKVSQIFKEKKMKKQLAKLLKIIKQRNDGLL